jgi:two-component system, NarL family, sensor histidine kinase UhpB
MARLPDFPGKTSRAARATLHGRVMLAAFAALAFSLAVGAVALLWDARRSVDAELGSAMASAAQAVRTGQEDAGGSPQRLVGVFDGNRHIRAVLLDSGGHVLLASRPYAPASPPPAWFVALIDPHASAQRLGSIRIEPEPINEIGEVWTGLRDALLIVVLLSVMALVLIRRAVTRALRPLEAVSSALARVGAGDLEARVEAAGVLELGRLAKGFNAMAGQLDAFDRENRRLNEQLLTVQEEERAELARDLHDEIGPYLFAVNIDAAAVGDLASGGRATDIPARVALIQSAVGHMQTQVADMLQRLRPIRAVEFGLASAVEDLVAFWRARRPDITFDLRIAADDAALGLGVREAFYRVAQEALSNAVRHGVPSRIAVEIGTADDKAAFVRVADNGEAGAHPGGRPRFGLVGMRERIGALGGVLTVDQGEGHGWSVLATLPLRDTAASRLEEAVHP